MRSKELQPRRPGIDLRQEVLSLSFFFFSVCLGPSQPLDITAAVGGESRGYDGTADGCNYIRKVHTHLWRLELSRP